MGKVNFQFDVKHLPTAGTALYVAASQILIELANERGNGPWFDKLRHDIALLIKNMDMSDQISIEDQASAVEASLAAVNGIFDRIEWC